MEVLGIYCFDGEFYEFCLEIIGGDEGDNISDVYIDIVDLVDNFSVKYFNIWF